MLDYTHVAGRKIYNDVRRISLVCNVLTQLFYIFYLVYAIGAGVGIFYANLTMLILSSAYFAFFVYNQVYGKKTTLTKAVKDVFKWSKRVVKLLNLVIMVYGIVYTSVEPDPLSVILTVLMAVLWIADILLEITVTIVKGWCNLLFESLKADVEFITKPATSVGNFFKKLSGKEVEEPTPPTKQRLYLDELVEEFRNEKRDKKMEERYVKQQAKEAKKRRQEEQDVDHAPFFFDETPSNNE